MTPAKRHAVIASLAVTPALVYEAVEIAQGDNGWPYSRFLRLLPPAVFVATLFVANSWLIPHILHGAARAADAIATAIEEATP